MHTSFNILLQEYTLGSKIILAILFSVLAYMLIHYAFKMYEVGYMIRRRKPLYNHFYWRLKKLNPKQRDVLKNQFTFYNKLSVKEQKYFEHRVASFIKDKFFIPRNGVILNDEIIVLISATAAMLTFGFRDFYIGLISKIVIYPSAFYSMTNKKLHKGEFNPKLKTLVLSWEDFKKGFDIDNDNLNLGIHEFTHAIHLNSIKERDVSSTLFSDSFKELSSLLATKPGLREQLVASKYFRKYAYTNKYEFLAVLIETFIETPQSFKSQFPEVYKKVKQMLNFNVAGY